jgi:hypothetical protein
MMQRFEQTASRYALAFVRTDQTERSGHGAIASGQIVITENLAGKDHLVLNIQPKEGRLVRTSGEEMPLSKEDYTYQVSTARGARPEPALPAAPFLIPNPATTRLSWTGGNRTEWQTMQVYNVVGGLVLQTKGLPRELEVADWPVGLYFVVLQGTNGSHTQRLFIQR